MTRGRKKLPDRIKQVLGSPDRAASSGASPKVPEGFPVCPREITGHARKEWIRLRRLLRNARFITPADRAALMGYCLAFGRMIDAEADIAKRGMILLTGAVEHRDPKTGKVRKTGGNMVQNPYLSIANRAMEQMRKFIADLGLSPTSRAGLRIPVSPGAPPGLAGQSGDALDEFLGGEDVDAAGEDLPAPAQAEDLLKSDVAPAPPPPARRRKERKSKPMAEPAVRLPGPASSVVKGKGL